MTPDNERDLMEDLVGMTISEIEEMSSKEPKTLIQRFLKLGEEVGELAQEIGINEGYSGYKYKQKTENGIQLECVDIMQVVLSIFFASGGTMQDLHTFILLKNKKWKEKMEKTE